MKKLTLFALFFLSLSFPLWAGNFYATGLNNPSEHWATFKTLGMTVSIENSGGFVEVEIHSRSQMVCEHYWNTTRCPSSQKFQVKIPFNLPAGAVLISAGVFSGGQWIDAKSVDVLRAEEIYQQTPQSDLRLLLRRVIKREYDGHAKTSYELRLSPIDKFSEFLFRIKYVIKTTPSLWNFRAAVRLEDFTGPRYNLDCRYIISAYFRDDDFPLAMPDFLYGGPSGAQWEKTNDNRWHLSVSDAVWNAYGAGITWPRFFKKGEELRLFENEDGKFYHLIMPSPVEPEERKPRHVLIVYDLAQQDSDNPSYWLNAFKVVADSGLTARDSINVLLTDFVPKILREHFVPASNQEINQLFSEINQAPQPQLSTLPQLLRAAKDFFNKEKTPGEVWLISNATKHSKPISVANEILDLSLRKFKFPVVFRIFDCSKYDWSSGIWINGSVYYGNDYLYENLARLSKGTVVKARKYARWELRDALANVFFPDVDAVEVDALPQGGFHESRFLLNGGRTHFPIAWPYMELGRYQGDLPFTVDYFGKVDGRLYKHTVSISDTFNTPHRDLLATMWNAYHVEDLLREPQSDATIREIGRVATKYHFLSPYNGFVIPGPSGLVAFKRLMEVDTSQAEETTVESQPKQFELKAFPNPFNLSTMVQLTFPVFQKAEKVQVGMYNLLGERVRSFQFDLHAGANAIQFRWNGESDEQRVLPSGIYLIVGKIGKFQKRIKVTLLK